MDTPPSAPERIVAASLWSAALAWTVARVAWPPLVWTLWSDRDLVRSWPDGDALPAMGAELSFGVGARIPGGWLHELWALPLWAGAGPLGVASTMAALDGVGAALLGAYVGHRSRPWAGALAALVYLTRPATLATTERLWNPGAMGLFVVLACIAGARVAVEDDARALPAWSLATVLAGQLHLTGGLVGLAWLPAILWRRPAGLARQAGWAALAAGLAFAPYLGAELATGFANTRALLAQPHFGGTAGAISVGSVAVGFVRQLAAVLAPASAEGWSAWAWPAMANGLLVLAAVGLVGPALRRDGPARREAWAWAIPVLVLGVVLLLDRRADLGSAVNGRHVFAAAGPVGAVVAFGAAWTWRHLPASVRPTAAVAGLAAVVATLVPAVPFWVSSHGDEADVRRLRVTLDALAERTGRSLDAVATRTVLLKHRPGKDWGWEAEDGIDSWLLADGLTGGHGSGRGPCVAWPLTRRPGLPLPDDVDSLQAALGDGVVVASARPLAVGEEQLVVYTTASGACPTSLTQRYVLTPTERRLRRLAPTVPPGTGRVIDTWGTEAVAVLPGGDLPGVGPVPPIPVMVRFFPWIDDDSPTSGVGVALHAEALRAKGFNGGPLVDARIDDVALRFEDPHGALDDVRVAWPGEGLGYGALAAPISTHVDVPKTVWRISLVGVRRAVPPGDEPGAPFEIELWPGLQVP